MNFLSRLWPSVCCALAVTLFVPCAQALEGELDHVFGNEGGGFSVMPAPLDFDPPFQLALDHQGRILTAGIAVNGTDLKMLRWLSGGHIDRSFGNEGIALLRYPADLMLSALVEQEDHRLLAAGCEDGRKLALARLLENGQPDLSFGSGGLVRTGFTIDALPAIVSRTDGTILVLASPHLFHLLADGRIDPSFGTAGKVDISLDGVNSLQVQPDGKILAAGSTTEPDSRQMVVHRFLPDGKVDTAFGTGGRVVTHFPRPAGLWGFTLLPDGRITAVGTMPPGIDNKTPPVLARWMPGGAPDVSLTGNGEKECAGLPFTQAPAAAAVRSDGRFYFAGNVPRVALPHLSRLAVLRFHADGTPDTAFSEAGTEDLADYDTYRPGTTILPAPGGGLFTLTWGYYIQLARFLEDPAPGKLRVEVPYGTPRKNGETVDLGSIAVGSGGRDVEFSFRNDGPGQLQFRNGGVRVLPGATLNPGVFSFSEKCLFSGGSAGTILRMEPVTTGPVSATFRIETADPDNSPFLLHVTATGRPPEPVMIVYPGEGGTVLPDQAVIGLGLYKDGILQPGGHSWSFYVHSAGGAELIVDRIELVDSKGITLLNTPSLNEDRRVDLELDVTDIHLGVRTARIVIHSNDTAHPQFSMNLVSHGETLLDSWRQLNFDPSAFASGDAEDTADPDKDGISNLLEFATGGDPHFPGVLPIEARLRGDRLEYTFSRTLSAAAFLEYTLQWSRPLPEEAGGRWTWHDEESPEPVVVPVGDDRETVTLSTPAGPAGSKFVRLRVVRPDWNGPPAGSP